jgi:CheY-like chemotaxis protein
METPTHGSQLRELFDVAQQAVRDLVENTPHNANAADLLTQATERIAQSLNASACTIRLVEDDALSVGVAWGYQNPASRAHLIPIDQRLQGLVERREPLMIPDFALDAALPPSRRERMNYEGFHAYLGVPMVASENVEGVLSLYCSTPHDFTEQQIVCLQSLADELALRVQQSRPSERAQTNVISRPTMAKGKILIVEDDSAVGTLLEKVLRIEGYRAAAFQTGSAALQFLERHNVQLVIVDLHLPDISGWQVARVVKQWSPHVPVLMITGWDVQLPKERLRQHPVDLVLPKPFMLSELMKAISMLLAR